MRSFAVIAILFAKGKRLLSATKNYLFIKPYAFIKRWFV